MSFILDALKKSETERQQQASAEFATVPASGGSSQLPRWLWVLGALLAINLTVLLGLFIRPDTQTPAIALPTVEVADEPAATPSFAEQVEVARQNAPPAQDSRVAEEPVDLQPAATVSRAVIAESPERTFANTATLPTFREVIANGSIVLPDLHLDIHVYSEVPGDRFVFINMSKLREQSRLSEGPMVSEITPDGVVLEYQGTTFLLPRD